MRDTATRQDYVLYGDTKQLPTDTQIELIKQSQAGERASEQLETCDGLSEEARNALLVVVADGIAARNRLINSYTQALLRIAEQVAPHCVHDAAQQGVFGLILAISKFDASRGIVPSTYLFNGIRFSALAFRRKYDARHSRATALRISEAVAQCEELVYGVNYDESAFEPRDFADLREALELLKPRSKYVLLERVKGRSLAELGRELCVCPERIRQIADKGRQELRRMLNGRRRVRGSA